MRSLSLFVLVLAAISVGCAGLRGTHARSATGDDCARGLECLPNGGSSRGAPTLRMERGWTLAASSFAMPPPPAPEASSDTDGLRPFWDSLDRWVERRTHVVEAARQQLDEAAEEDHRQRIVGGAIVGLMYEEVARELSEIPAPTALDDEPEIREVYRATLDGRARSFVEHARRAYSACAQNAVFPNDMHDWSRFCAAREDRLPERASWRGGPVNGETEVEFIAN